MTIKDDVWKAKRLHAAKTLANQLGLRVANAEIAVEEALRQVREALNNHPDLQQRLDNYRVRN